jgi:hypothetical protein
MATVLFVWLAFGTPATTYAQQAPYCLSSGIKVQEQAGDPILPNGAFYVSSYGINMITFIIK